MSRKRGRQQRAAKKYKFPTAQPHAETSFEAFPNGVRSHTAKTENGTLAYLYVRDEMRKTLWSMCAHFLLCARAGGPIDFDEIARLAGADMPYDIIVDVDQAFVSEAESCVQHALDLLDGIAPQLLIHISEQLLLEVFYRAICDRRGEGSCQFSASESELLTLFSEHVVKRLKQRVTPRRKPSSKLEWTPERCEEYLVIYERSLEVLQKAKAIYQRNRGDEWRKMIRAVLPELPDHYIERLHLRGDAEPGDMAREYAAELFGVNNTSYLKKIISRARDARLSKLA